MQRTFFPKSSARCKNRLSLRSGLCKVWGPCCPSPNHAKPHDPLLEAALCPSPWCAPASSCLSASADTWIHAVTLHVISGSNATKVKTLTNRGITTKKLSVDRMLEAVQHRHGRPPHLIFAFGHVYVAEQILPAHVRILSAQPPSSFAGFAKFSLIHALLVLFHGNGIAYTDLLGDHHLEFFPLPFDRPLFCRISSFLSSWLIFCHRSH